MSIVNILIITQIVVSISLLVSILMQKRGASLGSAFGGSGGGYYQKRGAEKLFYNASVVLAILFVVISFVILLFS